MRTSTLGLCHSCTCLPGWVIALALALVNVGAHAQSDKERIAELERRLEQSLQQIQLLTQRVQQLEDGQEPGQVAVSTEPAAQALETKVHELEQEISAVANRPEANHGLALHGFADVGLVKGSKGRKAAGTAGSDAGANLGALGFYLTPQFTDRTKALIELVFEVDETGSVIVDLERLQVGYTVADELTMWVGRFHTPYGYWNTAFHHGAQIQTAIQRPVFLDFEDAGGILPAHSVGLWGTGGVKLGAGRVSYDAYFANSPTIDMADAATAGTGTLNPNLSGAANHSATVGGNLGYSFRRGGLRGLALGAHAFTSKVIDTLANVNETRLVAYGGWLAYLEDNWEVLGEVYRFRNRDLSGGAGTHSSDAGYVQVGRSFFGEVTPFARYERTSLNQNDNYFAQMESGQSYQRKVFGLRYDLNPTTALKLEATRTKLTDRITDTYSEIRAQWAVRF